MDHRTLVATVSEVCPLPASASRLMALTSDPEASMDEIVATVSSDPAISAEVMRIGSSPAYAGRQAPADVRAATTRIGMRELADIAAAAAMLVAFRSEHELSLAIHDRAVFSSNLASAAAAHLGHPRPRTAALTGLLCEIGALACLAVDAEAYAARILRAGVDPDLRAALERERYGASSPEIGAALLERNALPAPICEAVRGSAAAEDVLLAVVTRLARNVAPVVLDDARRSDESWTEHVHGLASALGLSLGREEVIALVVGAADDAMAQVAMARAS